MRSLVLFLFAAFVLVPGLCQRSVAMPISWPQDELVKRSDVIAVVKIYEVFSSAVSGSIFSRDGTEFPTAPILYTSEVTEVLHGRLPKNPLIIQYDGSGDLDSLEKGSYLLFLTTEGHLFTPLTTSFKIKRKKIFWYQKPFFVGDYGPEMGEVPLDKAIAEVRELIKKYKD